MLSRLSFLGVIILTNFNISHLFAQSDYDRQIDYPAHLVSNVLNLDDSLGRIDSAIKAYQVENNRAALARLWNEKGNLYSQRSYYNSSYECYKQSLLLFEELKDYKGIGNCYINFARLSEHKDKQLYYYRKALDQFSMIEDTLGVSKVLNNIGVTYEEAGNLDSALYYFEYALDIGVKNNYPKTKAACLTNLGNVSILKGKCREALAFLDSAEVIFISLGMKNGLTYNIGKKGEAHYCLYQKDSALFYFKEHYRLAIETGQRAELLAAINSLKKYYEEKEKYPRALRYANQALKLEKEISEDSKLEYSDMLNYEMDVQKKNQELEKIQLKERLRTVRLTAIAIGILLVFVIVIQILFKQRAKIKNNKIIVQQKEALIWANIEKHKQELHFKNKELRQLSNYILQKRDFVELVKKQIIQIKKLNHAPEVIKKINQALVILNGQLNLAQDNQILHAGMEEIQKKFLRQLKDAYPKLTPGDIKLLSLLSIDLSSKEIAPIMGISVESLNTKRYRLRKKLNMPSNMSFHEFLQRMT